MDGKNMYQGREKGKGLDLWRWAEEISTTSIILYSLCLKKCEHIDNNTFLGGEQWVFVVLFCEL